MLNDILEKIARREDLSADEMAKAVGVFVDYDCEPAQIAGFLMALRVKGETVDELVGAATAFRQRAVRLPDSVRPVLCTAGTGGDRFGSINLYRRRPGRGGGRRAGRQARQPVRLVPVRQRRCAGCARRSHGTVS